MCVNETNVNDVNELKDKNTYWIQVKEISGKGKGKGKNNNPRQLELKIAPKSS